MLDPSPRWLNEVFFPEAISRETEISCPACGAVLTVALDDPMGSQTYKCSECRPFSRTTGGRSRGGK